MQACEMYAREHNISLEEAFDKAYEECKKADTAGFQATVKKSIESQKEEI